MAHSFEKVLGAILPQFAAIEVLPEAEPEQAVAVRLAGWRSDTFSSEQCL